MGIFSLIPHFLGKGNHTSGTSGFSGITRIFNGLLSTLEGPVFVDPNVHFGHPELDLAFVDYFQPVPEALFAAYTEVLPIDEDFPERRELWRLPFYLAMVEGQGGLPRDRLRAVLDQFK